MCAERKNELRWKYRFQISPETTSIPADFTWFSSVSTSPLFIALKVISLIFNLRPSLF